MNNSFSLWWPMLGTVGGWLLIVIGWIVVRHDNDRRYAIREERDKVYAIIILIQEINDFSQKYYSLDGSDPEEELLGWQIVDKFNWLGKRHLEVLSIINSKHDHIEARVEFWKAVTGAQFQSKKRPPSKPGDQVLIDISDTARRLITKLEKIYFKQISHN